MSGLHLVDTDTLTLFQHGHPVLVKRVIADVPQGLTVSVISVEE